MATINNQMGYPMGATDYGRSYTATPQYLYSSPVPQQNYMHQPPIYLKCRPVSSREEAMAFQIDLDGSLNVFTDIANQRIYTKQINNDGTATFNTYVLTPDKEFTNETSEYVTKEEFNNVIQTLMATMTQQQSAQSNKVGTQVSNIKF